MTSAEPVQLVTSRKGSFKYNNVLSSYSSFLVRFILLQFILSQNLPGNFSDWMGSSMFLVTSSTRTLLSSLVSSGGHHDNPTMEQFGHAYVRNIAAGSLVRCHTRGNVRSRDAPLATASEEEEISPVWVFERSSSVRKFRSTMDFSFEFRLQSFIKRM